MVSEKPWRPEAVLFLGAAILLILSLSFITLALIREKDAAPGFVDFAIATIGFQCVSAGLVHFFLRLHGVRWSEFLGLRRRRVALFMVLAIFIAILATLLGWAVGYVSSEMMKALHQETKPQPVVEVLAATEHTAQRILFALTAIVLAPLIEETLFRGILYPLLKQHGYPRLALWGTSLLFAAIHLHLLSFIPLFLFALLLVALYEWTDALIAPITAHATFNAINFVLMINQSEVKRWLETLRERV